MKEQFQKDLIQSAFLHKPLPLYEEGALEKEWEKRDVLLKNPVLKKGMESALSHEGEGNTICYEDDTGSLILGLKGNTVTYCWPEAMSPDGDYAFYGMVHAKLKINNENWENFNCLTFYVKPDCDGSRVVNVNVSIKNQGTVKIPDEYYREGNHVVNLINHEWNRCIWEFGSMARDQVTELAFSCRLNGKDTATGEEVSYLVKEICLEKTEKAEPDKGWFCNEGIAYSTSGYFLNGDKTAVTSMEIDSFCIMDDSTKSIVYDGLCSKGTYLGKEYRILDFSPLNKEGSYYIQAGGRITKSFTVSEEVYEEALWKVVNFLFCERCGYPVPGRHGHCHKDVVAKHGDKIISFCGGWHDAGDMSQQLIHTAEVTQALFEMAEAVKLKQERQQDFGKISDRKMDLTELLYERLIEEASWGLEFVIGSRFGDGYRAASAGIVRWTNGIIGDEDDEKVRYHNHAFENLLCSGVCTVAAGALKESDKELSFKCLEIAKEDFAFGMERFTRVGMELPIMWEHTYSSSKSQYYALITWCAALLYEATGERLYGDTAARYGNCLLECQETGVKTKGFTGFFYRDEEKISIVHYNHQSREYMFTKAFELLCKTQPDHKDKPRWEKALSLYGTYLKLVMNYASPYRMIPAGLHHEKEAEDKETFKLLHLLVDYEEQKEHYKAQLKQGIALGDGYYIKNFPVWFSFRGNTAVHLAMGMAAAATGSYFNDISLVQIAKDQLYWISGRNPFRQSLLYGEGDRYVQQYAVMPGEMTGEIPVGIETNEDEDLPYWPHNNNATYKEVWTSSACRWLWTLGAIYHHEYGISDGAFKRM